MFSLACGPVRRPPSDVIPPDIVRQIVFGLACDGTGIAPDAPIYIHEHSKTHGHSFFSRALPPWRALPWICASFTNGTCSGRVNDGGVNPRL